MERVAFWTPSNPYYHREMNPWSTVGSIPHETPVNMRGMSAANADANVMVYGEATPKAHQTPSPLSPDNQVISNTSSHKKNHKNADDMSSHRKGRWTLDEKVLFLHGLKTYGKGRWKKISIFLPHRSLVQIKSHAQKVLKREEAGENVYRRLDEQSSRLECLVKAVFDEQGIKADHMIPQPAKKRKPRTVANKKKPSNNHSFFPAATASQERYEYFSHAISARAGYPTSTHPTVPANTDATTDRGSSTAVAAAALCQLSGVEPPFAPIPMTTSNESLSSIPERQNFSPVVPDPTVLSRPRNVVSPN